MSDLIFKIEKRANDKYDLIYEGTSNSYIYQNLTENDVERVALAALDILSQTRINFFSNKAIK